MPDDSDEPPRYGPNEPWPPYSYVTGRFPHPTSDPAGHSYGHAPRAAAPLDPACWGESPEYLRGVDLFNRGYYWEAHEVWESAWRVVDRHSPVAQLLQGLIKLAAAGVKAREGRAEGVRRHARRAREMLGLAQAGYQSSPEEPTDSCCGLLLDELMAACGRLIEAPPPQSPVPGAVERVLTIQLRVR